MTTPRRSARAEAAIRRFALSYPETHEDFPWGDRLIKVRNKVFVFMYAGDNGFWITVKLPASHPAALMEPFAAPAGYGLGRAGWVTCSFSPEEDPPIGVLREWVDESFRAVAPKALSKTVAMPGADG
jgi:predicted DNA-binding protein (MmcQ/YjbR family)